MVITLLIYTHGQHKNYEDLKRLAITTYRSCGQMIVPFGSRGEQIQPTNFAQQGNMSNIYKLRGGYS